MNRILWLIIMIAVGVGVQATHAQEKTETKDKKLLIKPQTVEKWECFDFFQYRRWETSLKFPSLGREENPPVLARLKRLKSRITSKKEFELAKKIARKEARKIAKELKITIPEKDVEKNLEEIFKLTEEVIRKNEWGEIEVSGSTQKTKFRVDGINRRWNFGLNSEGGYNYAFIIKPDKSAAYYNFTGSKGKGVKPSQIFKCEQL